MVGGAFLWWEEHDAMRKGERVGEEEKGVVRIGCCPPYST